MSRVRELTLKPSLPMRVGIALLFVMCALLFAAALKDLPPRGVHDYAIIVIVVICLYAAITYPMRAVVFANGTVRVRSLGRWSTTALPPKVRVVPGLSLGSLYVMDNATNRVLVILKSEFGPLESLEARTKEWLRAENRLA